MKMFCWLACGTGSQCVRVCVCVCVCVLECVRCVKCVA